MLSDSIDAIFIKNSLRYLALKLVVLEILHFSFVNVKGSVKGMLRKSEGFPEFLTSMQDNSADF